MMKTKYLLLAALAVLGTSASLVKADRAQIVVQETPEKVSHEHRHHRHRLRKRIHEHRMRHRDKMNEHVHHPHRGKIREKMHEHRLRHHRYHDEGETRIVVRD